MYIKECVHSLTHSLTQYGPGDSMEDWVSNFGVQIGFEALTPTKTSFCKILPTCSLRGADVKNTF